MKANFEQKRANRLERFQELAEKNDQLSESLFEQAHKMASVIPMGQPILVGHHSEKGDRRYRAKIEQKGFKALEVAKKADYYRDRAESLLNNTAISSDDPNALDKLREKLQRLEDFQGLAKEINKICRAKCGEAEKVVKLGELGIKEAAAIKLLTPEGWWGTGIPRFTLTNNNATIRNVKARISKLESVAQLETTEIEVKGVRIKQNIEENRLQLFFPSIPSEETRKKLKSSGFRWSPTEGAWQRQISNGATWAAKEILKSLPA